MGYRIEYENWLTSPLLCSEGVEELTALKEDEQAIEYRFGAELEFGTAGMRGILGYGTNMMNVYTVRRATQGLAEYIRSLGDKARMQGVVISYDTRKNSERFAREAAGVLSATDDGTGQTVIDLLPERLQKRGLFPSLLNAV